MGRRGYPPEVRRRALELVGAGQSVAHVARTLDVSVQVIYRWRAQAAHDRADESGPGVQPADPGDQGSR